MQLVRQFCFAFGAGFAAVISGIVLFGQVCVYRAGGITVCQTYVARLVNGPKEEAPGIGRFPLGRWVPVTAAIAAVAALLYTVLVWSLTRLRHPYWAAQREKLRAALLVLLCVVVAFLGSTVKIVSFQPAVFLTEISPLAKDVRVCPDGHATLKDIPIVYGLPPMNGPDAVEWERAVGNLEFMPGGCAVDPARSTQVVCATCKLIYWGQGRWNGTATNPAAFSRPFTRFINDWPLPAPTDRVHNVTFSQDILSNRVVSERLYYSSRKSPGEIQVGLTNWLVEHGMPTSFAPAKDLTTLPTNRVETFRLAHQCLKIDFYHDLIETNVAIIVTHDLAVDRALTNRPCALPSR